jgi:DNA-binding winged helix-turn-helix (wHTH) protein
MVEFGRFGIFADGRSISLGGRAFEVLMALIEASRAVVSKDQLLAGSSIRTCS